MLYLSVSKELQCECKPYNTVDHDQCTVVETLFAKNILRLHTYCEITVPIIFDNILCFSMFKRQCTPAPQKLVPYSCSKLPWTSQRPNQHSCMCMSEWTCTWITYDTELLSASILEIFDDDKTQTQDL